MGWFSKKLTTATITPEMRAQIEEMYAAGFTSSEIATDTGASVVGILTVCRSYDAREKRATGKSPRSSYAQMDDPEIARLKKDIEKEKLDAELSRIKDENRSNSKKRELEIELLELEIADKRRDMEEPEEEMPEFPLPMESENAWLGELFRFMTTLMNKPPKNVNQAAIEYAQAVAQVPQAVDPTKPLSVDSIRAELDKVDPRELASLRSAPESLVEHGLKSKYPGILPENIKAIQFEIRHYVHHGSRSSDSSSGYTRDDTDDEHTRQPLDQRKLEQV